jgi:hypothetical protein
MNDALSDARNMMVWAISSGLPTRLSGTVAARPAFLSAVPVKRFSIPVSIGPGATMLTRTPEEAAPSLWSQDGQSKIAALPLAPHTAYRRSELQAMYSEFAAEIEKLNQRVEEQACERPGARLLMTHPGVGPITALATDDGHWPN